MYKIQVGEHMSFSYKPLWKYLLDKDLSKTEMRLQIGLSPATIAKMSKDEYVSLEVLDRICCHFKIQPSDVLEWKDDK